MKNEKLKLLFAGALALLLCGCCETLQVQVLSNNNILATRCQSATALTNAVASGSASGGGTTSLSVPIDKVALAISPSATISEVTK